MVQRKNCKRGQESVGGTRLFNQSCRNMLTQYQLVTASSPFIEHKEFFGGFLVFYYSIILKHRAVFFYFGVLPSKGRYSYR